MTDAVEALISAELVGQRLALTPVQVHAEFAELGFVLAGELRFRWSEIEARLEARRGGAPAAAEPPPAAAKRRPRSRHSGRQIDRQTITERRKRFPITSRKRSS